MDTEDSYRFHNRALAGDPVVSGEVWERLHAPLIQRLRRRFGALDEADIEDAVSGVVFQFCERPRAYNPEKLTLDRYLGMAAHADLLNLIAKRKRETQGIIVIPFDPVAHDRQSGNTVQDTEESSDEGSDAFPNGVARETMMPKLREIFPSSADREVLEMMIDRVRETERYARVIGCDDLAPEAQRRLVKQTKDRIRVRLKRFGLRSDA